MLLTELCRLYCDGRLNLSAGAADQLRYAVRAFAAWLNREPILADLTKMQVIAFLRAYAADHSPATANSKRSALLTLWRAAAEEGYLPQPPRIEKLRAPERLPVVWTLAEMRQLLDAAELVEGEWHDVPTRLCWRFGLLCLWDSAARIGELLTAELTDVDLTAGTWYAPANHRKGRRADKLYRLHGDTLAAIRESLAWPRKLLWPFPHKRGQVWRHFERLLLLAGLPSGAKRKFHCVRRTAETYAAAERGDAWAAEVVGHSLSVARASYINPLVALRPALIDALPRF